MLRSLAVVAITLTARLLAQESGSEPVTSGPTAGTALPALRVHAPAGPDAGLELDLSTSIGQGPGAVLFVHELTRNVAPLVRGLDQLGDSHALLGLTVGIVVLAEDRNEAERRVDPASRSLRMARPMLISIDGAMGPGAFALDRRASLTLVTCNDGKVVRSTAFTDTGRQDLTRLRELVEEVTGALPATPGELRDAAMRRLPSTESELRARAAHLALELHWRNKRDAEEAEDRSRRDQQQADRPRDGMRDAARAPQPSTAGKAPTDDGLRELLRAAIRRDADAKQLDETFAHIRARAAESDALRQQAVSMLELMLGLDYGTEDAKVRARRQLEEWKKDR